MANTISFITMDTLKSPISGINDETTYAIPDMINVTAINLMYFRKFIFM